MTRFLRFSGTALAWCVSASLLAQADPPRDKAVPTEMVSLALPSHGSQLLGVFYLAPGAGPHPTVVLMHGFPGYEQNLDLAQAIRRAGWNVLAVHYRGSWGVKGIFSFTHAIEDADSEVAFVLDPDNAAKYRIDTKKIVLVGHSMGGYMVASAGAHHPGVVGVAMISAWNIGGQFQKLPATMESVVLKGFGGATDPIELMPLAGCTIETLSQDIFDHRTEYTFEHLAPMLAPRPLLVVSSDDGMAPMSETMVESLKKAGDTRVQTAHLATDHSYSDQRLVLTELVVKWLGTL